MDSVYSFNKGHFLTGVCRNLLSNTCHNYMTCKTFSLHTVSAILLSKGRERELIKPLCMHVISFKEDIYQLLNYYYYCVYNVSLFEYLKSSRFSVSFRCSAKQSTPRVHIFAKTKHLTY